MSSVGSSTATRRVWRAAPAPGAFGAVAITARLFGVIRQSPFRQHGSGGAGQMPRAVGNGLILPKVGSRRRRGLRFRELSLTADAGAWAKAPPVPVGRSEEHTSELQSRSDLVCRLLLEKKKNNKDNSCIDVAYT